jgi:hypothetical protein
VTCEGERLSFRNGIERVSQGTLHLLRRIRHRRCVDDQVGRWGAEIWIAVRQIGLAQELAQHRVTQARNDRAARVIGYPLARRTRTILHIDFVAFFKGMSSSANEFHAFSTGGVRQAIW